MYNSKQVIIPRSLNNVFKHHRKFDSTNCEKIDKSPIKNTAESNERLVKPRKILVVSDGQQPFLGRNPFPCNRLD